MIFNGRFVASNVDSAQRDTTTAAPGVDMVLHSWDTAIIKIYYLHVL